MDMLIVVLTCVGLAVSGVAAWAAIRSVVLTKRGLEIQQEQLGLQRAQASMIPQLEFSAVRYLEPQSMWDVRDTLKLAEKGKQEEEQKEAKRAQYQHDLATWEARKKISSMGSL